jgi:hypothetical protein
MPDWFTVSVGIVRIRLKTILSIHIVSRIACFNTIVKEILRCLLRHGWAYLTPSARKLMLFIVY